MAAYRQAVTNIAGLFKGYQVDHIDRWLMLCHNSALSVSPPNVFLDVLHNPSVKLPLEEDLAIPDLEAQLVVDVRATPDWMVPYLAYLTRDKLPQDELIASQIVRCSKSMTIVHGELHRRSITGVFQCCVSPDEGREILNEIHSGDCGHHVGSRSLVAKAFRHGFYWLTAHADAEDIVHKCDGC
ncbi:uncharacterized protein [Aegilops tauschii subsp. strangulata]|uniref:uncharacterized protein n=1 Tax=Aegilops tauschii subsp. strangulata TaxID=200361 RepID=UPI001ABCEB29|nr:uncharacterized protein LOC120975624 [Aegilops tauschii subsp. strangulata]